MRPDVASMVRISPSLLADMNAFHQTAQRIFDRLAFHMRWWALGSRDPWPSAGFNPHLHTFPEKDYEDEWDE